MVSEGSDGARFMKVRVSGQSRVEEVKELLHFFPFLSSLPFTHPLSPAPFPSFPPFPSPALPLAVGPFNTAMGSGERCKHSLRRLGRSPHESGALNLTFGGTNFTNFPESY